MTLLFLSFPIKAFYRIRNAYKKKVNCIQKISNIFWILLYNLL